MPDYRTKEKENIYNRKGILGKLKVTVIYGGGGEIKTIINIGKYYTIYLDVLCQISVLMDI